MSGEGGLLDREYGQDGGPLSDINPGERLRNVAGNVGPDIGQSGEGLSAPDEPGPAALGRTPLVGTLRRSRDLPVARDQIPDLME